MMKTAEPAGAPATMKAGAPVAEQAVEWVADPVGAALVPLFPSAPDPVREGFLRLINTGNEEGSALIYGTDGRGATPEASVRFDIPAAQTLTVSSSDIETGAGVRGIAHVL